MLQSRLLSEVIISLQSTAERIYYTAYDLCSTLKGLAAVSRRLKILLTLDELRSV